MILVARGSTLGDRAAKVRHEACICGHARCRISSSVMGRGIDSRSVDLRYRSLTGADPSAAVR